MKRIRLLALVLAIASGATAAVAFAATSPKAVRALVVRTALAQKSLRWVEHDFAGNVIVTSSADVNANSGSQFLTVQLGGKQTGTIHIIFINDTAYVQGEALGLAVNLGLTQAQAAQYAGKWISVTKGDKAYANTADGLTLGSIVHDVTPRGSLELSKKKVRGKRVIALEALSGPSQARVFHVLAAPARGKQLPIEASSIDPARSLFTHTDFSRWNVPVHVTAPSGSIPIATVRG